MTLVIWKKILQTLLKTALFWLLSLASVPALQVYLLGIVAWFMSDPRRGGRPVVDHELVFGSES